MIFMLLKNLKFLKKFIRCKILQFKEKINKNGLKIPFEDVQELM